MKKFHVLSLLFLLLSGYAFAQQVSIPIIISDGSATGKDTLKFGLDPSATDCIDASLGEYELPPTPPGGVFDARLVGTNIGITCLGQGIKYDYRQGSSIFIGTKMHQLKFQPGTGTTITIYWNLPAGVSGRLFDIILGTIVTDTMMGSGSLVVEQPTVFTSLKMRINYLPPPAQPSLLSPSNGLTCLGLTPTLDWNDVTGAVTYRLQIATDSLFTTIIRNDSTLTTSQYTVTSGLLNYYTKYYWRVNAKNISGSGPYSTVFNFTTLLSVPNLLTPASGSGNIPLNATLDWTDVSGATKYRLQVSTDSNFITTLINDSTLTTSQYTFSAGILTNLTKYFWRVKGYRVDCAGDWSGKFNFTTIVAQPNPPNLISPANGLANVSITPLLDWSDSPTATSYRVQVSTDSNFATAIINDSTIAISQYQVLPGALANLTKYYWRVNAKNIGGTSLYSIKFNFTTIIVPPGIPTLVSPANGALNISLIPTLDWSDVATATGYKLQVSTNAGFTSFVINDSSLIASQYIVLPGVLSNNVQYFWRVYAKNAGGYGLSSTQFVFTTIVPIPGAPALIFPANNSAGNQINLNLVWNKPQYSAGYNMVLATDTGFTTIILNDSLLTDSVKALSNLTPLTNYYWKVRAKNVAGWGAFSTVYTFKTVGIPTQVLLSTPANNSTGQPVNLTFKWFKAFDQVFNLLIGNSNKGDDSDGPNAISNYWFEIATDSLFTNFIAKDSTLTDTTKSIVSLLNLTTYYWRVKAKNQIGWAEFSSKWKFTTIIMIPVAPVLLLPANNSTNVSLTPLLDWGDVPTAVTYRIQISTDSNFVTTAWDTSGVAVSQLTVPAGKLTGLVRYYWRVNATNAGGTGPYSAIWNFRTLQNLSLNLKVYLEGFWNGTAQVSDTTMVYLSNQTTPFAFVDSAKVVLSTTGTALTNFTKVANGSYYIVVKHRNHLETWSKLPQAFVTNVAVAYDFTTAANKAFGDNMKQFGSVWVLYGGDANKDGAVDALDVAIFIVQFGNSGYLSCDFNGDGAVDALDVPIITANFGLGKAVPTLDVQLPGNIKKEKVIEEIQKRFKLNGESDKKETFKKSENKLN